MIKVINYKMGSHFVSAIITFVLCLITSYNNFSTSYNFVLREEEEHANNKGTVRNVSNLDEVKMNCSSIPVDLVNQEEVQVPNLDKYKKWTVTVNMTLPSNETVYWCNFFKGPKLYKKHHMIGYDVYLNDSISRDHTHHVDLYKCIAPSGGSNPDEYFAKYMYPGNPGYECYYTKEYFPVQHCHLFTLQWSIGGQLTMFPDNVGLPIGETSNVSEYYMAEIHFNNPGKLQDLHVNAGLVMYYTDQLREADAGFLHVGSDTAKTYSITVPPNSTDYTISSHCSSECTNGSLPPDGIRVFLVTLHAHKNARKVRVRHFRNGTELPWLANNEAYHFTSQNNARLFGGNQVNLLLGDQLTIECTYDNMWKAGGSTLGGRSPNEEMCQSFLMYYPRIDGLNLCGSYYPQSSMLSFMGIQNVTLGKGDFDPIIQSPPKYAGLRYGYIIENLITWTPVKRSTLNTLIRYGAHESYCTSGQGKTKYGLVSYPQVEQEYQQHDEECVLQ